jgi:integrase/recombinase XerD
VSRRASCLSSFYKWAMKNGLVETDPAYLADKPKRRTGYPGVAGEEGAGGPAGATRRLDELPENIFGRTREHIILDLSAGRHARALRP